MHPTERFLSLVWPSVGNKAIVTIQNKNVKHYWYDATQTADAARDALSFAQQGIDVYCALAGFTGQERKADQVQAVRSCWLDIDCGVGKAYATRAQGVAALESFLTATALPIPLIVSSGYGLHVYWVLEHDASRSEWQLLADQLKRLCVLHGLQADPKCTGDAARILRPIGTSNYKNGTPQRVRVLNKANITVDESTVTVALGVVVREVGEQDFDWSAKPEGVTSSDNPFTAFAIPEAIGEGGRNDTLFKFGSSLRAKGYDAAAVRSELHKANVEKCHPPLDNNEVDIIAASCCKFPQGLAQVKQVNGTLTFKHPWIRVTGHGLEISMPKGKPDANNVQQYEWIKIARHGIRPVMELKLPINGAIIHYLWVETYDEHDKPRSSFLVRFTGVSNSATFSTECGDHGYSLDAEKFPIAYRNFHHIMREWVRKLQAQQGAAITFKSFGWVGPDNSEQDAFFLGHTLYKKDGAHPAPPVPTLTEYQNDMVRKGTLDAWTKAIDNYNLPGMEAYMFASWTAWAAPLMVFTSSQNIVFHLVGNTGVGKSSLQRAIMSTYGRFSSKQLVDGSGSTFNSVGGVMGMFNALPYCKEEVTEDPPEQLAAWALSMTQGREKGRMNQQRGVDHPRTWNTVAVTSANVSLREIIRNERMDNAARLARIWEQDMTLPMDQMDALHAFSGLTKNYGHAGPVYIEYLVQNYDDVKQLVIETEETLFVTLKARGEERFNVGLLAAAFVGATIAINLGLIHHDFARGRDYAIRQYNRIRHGIKRETQTSDQLLGAMLQEIQPNTLIVEYDSPPNAGVHIFDTDNNVIKGVPSSLPVTARFAKMEARLYVATNVIQEWYADHRLNFASDMDTLEKAGILMHRNKKTTLTKGTRREDRFQTRCYWFDLSQSPELIEAI